MRVKEKMITYCSPHRFERIVQRLKPHQKDAVMQTGFGGLLFFRCKKLRRTMLNWLINQFNERKQAFRIGGHELAIRNRDMTLIMGLSTEGDTITLDQDEGLCDELRQTFDCGGDSICLNVLEKHLKGEESGDDFKRAFILYALAVVLCPGVTTHARAAYLPHLVDLEHASQLAWGKHVISTLLRSLTAYRRGEKGYLSGCLVFLQFWYFEHVMPNYGDICGERNYPLMRQWSEEEIDRREMREVLAGGVGTGKVIVEICPDINVKQIASEFKPTQMTTQRDSAFCDAAAGQGQDDRGSWGAVLNLELKVVELQHAILTMQRETIGMKERLQQLDSVVTENQALKERISKLEKTVEESGSGMHMHHMSDVEKEILERINTLEKRIDDWKSGTQLHPRADVGRDVKERITVIGRKLEDCEGGRHLHPKTDADKDAAGPISSQEQAVEDVFVRDEATDALPSISAFNRPSSMPFGDSLAADKPNCRDKGLTTSYGLATSNIDEGGVAQQGRRACSGGPTTRSPDVDLPPRKSRNLDCGVTEKSVQIGR